MAKFLYLNGNDPAHRIELGDEVDVEQLETRLRDQLGGSSMAETIIEIPVKLERDVATLHLRPEALLSFAIVDERESRLAAPPRPQEP